MQPWWPYREAQGSIHTPTPPKGVVGVDENPCHLTPDPTCETIQRPNKEHSSD